MYSLLQYALPYWMEFSANDRLAAMGVISSQGVKLSPVNSKFNGTGSSITSEYFSQGDRSTPFFS